MTGWRLAQEVVLLVLLTASVVDDLRRRRISNWLTLPALLIALLLALVSGGWGTLSTGLTGALAGALAAGGLFLLLWLTSGGIGGGDAKLMTAVGALVGFPAALGVLLFVALAGGVQGLLALVVSRPPVKRLLARAGVPGTDHPAFGKKVRYALAIAFGTLAFQVWLAVSPPAAAPVDDSGGISHSKNMQVGDAPGKNLVERRVPLSDVEERR